jgi:transcriptional regulator with XRE-family HTH domain
MKLNEKIKKYRKIFDLSQEQLAEILNVSRQVITKWESDNGLPDIENLKLLSKTFNVSIDYLLDENEEVAHPVLREAYELEKNNFNTRYDYTVSYLKEKYP